MQDFHSSMTKGEYVEGSKTLKFTTKLNARHVATALKIDPNTAGFNAKVQEHINQNFELWLNGIKKPLTFTATQVDGETVWIYFEANQVNSLGNVKVKNTILMNAYPRQLNQLNISYRGAQKNFRSERGLEIAEADF